MKKTLFTLLLAVGVTLSAWAVPAHPGKRKVKQPDGTELTVRMVGDEHFHCYMTLDNVPLVRTQEGSYVYAKMEGETLMPTERIAHDKSLRSADEITFIANETATSAEISEAFRSRRNAANASRLKSVTNEDGTVSRVGTAPEGGWKGSKKGLVILVQFQDVKFRDVHTRELFDRMFNEKGFNYEGANGSVADYFADQSYGQFTPTFDVVGPVTVSSNMAYYGGNNNYGNDSHAAEMINEAVLAVDSQVNFADYDWDGDGEVENFYVIYAGYAESYSGNNEDTVWPHQSNLWGWGYRRTCDGVKVNRYACSQEINGWEAYGDVDLTGIGTPCHEFSHCLGLVDLYDIDYSGADTPENWTVMSGGSYNNDGYTPSAYTAYERNFCSWLDFTELTEGTEITDMPAVTSEPVAYIIYNEGNRNECYILENRQKEGWDSYQYGHGMMVFHMDYDQDVWLANSPNNEPGHSRFMYVPADNSLGTSKNNLAGDPFPGTKKNTALTDYSTPAATLFNPNSDGSYFLHKPIENITESADGKISFVFDGGTKLPAPVVLSAGENVTKNSFRAAWQPVSGVESYTVELKQSGTSTASVLPILSTDFSGVAAGVTEDGTEDINSALNSLLPVQGWTGYNLFVGTKGLKIGKSGAAGYLYSPLQASPSDGNVTVAVKAYPEDGASVEMKVLLVNSNNVTISLTKKITMDGSLQVMTFTGITAPYKVKFFPTQRGYISYASVYDGDYTAEEVGDGGMNAGDGTQTFSGLTDTKLDCTELQENGSYQWRVCGVFASNTTKWSAWQNVQLGENAGIDAIVLDNVSAATPVEVYGTDGRLVRRTSFGNWKKGLQPGSYVVRTANGAATLLNE
ncbi:MAG: M6 family metalloprotease domain-containing protein [Alloprevotella sp.]